MLYGNLTIKDWMSLQCNEDDAQKVFAKALERNDEPMSVLAAAELVRRGAMDVLASTIADAIDAKHLDVDSRFGFVLNSAIQQCSRGASPKLADLASWARLRQELCEDSELQVHEVVEQYLKEKAESPCRFFPVDKRIRRFVKSLRGMPNVSAEFGIYYPNGERDGNTHVQLKCGEGPQCCLRIRNGFIVDTETVPRLLSIMDDADVGCLPAFPADGKKFDYYVLSGNHWVHVGSTPQNAGEFYMSIFDNRVSGR